MNSIILVRGTKIAFNKFPGSYGDSTYMTQDHDDMMTTFGLFMPVADHGMQVLPMLRDEAVHLSPFHKFTDTFKLIPGVKGLLIQPGFRDIDIYVVRIGAGDKLVIAPLAVGYNGFACISQWDHLEENMAMCVRLTNTIEESVDMFCRHHSSNRSHVRILSFAEMKQQFKGPYKMYADFERWCMKAIKQPEQTKY